MLKSVKFPHVSDQDAMLISQRFRKSLSGSLPLELVGEEGWLIFTRSSLKRWGGLRRTNRILKHKRGWRGRGGDSIMSYKGHQNYSWDDTESTICDSDCCFWAFIRHVTHQCRPHSALPRVFQTMHRPTSPEANSKTPWRK